MDNGKIIHIDRTIDTDKEIVVYQKKIAAFLLICNCELSNVNIDLKDNSRYVYFFKKSNKVDRFLQVYDRNKNLLNKIVYEIKSCQ